MDKTLTEYEKLSMSKVINVSDGHARQLQCLTQKNIIKILPDIFDFAEKNPQDSIEATFKSDFFSLAGQPSIINEYNLNRVLLCHSSSSSIEIVANYLRRKMFKVALIEPTFDNIPRILLRHNISLISLPESQLHSDDIDSYVKRIDANAIFIVCPNNPTGLVLPQNQFVKLAEACKATGKMLIIDTCFRLFSQEMFWDQYFFLDKIGLTYAFIEDTGKTWPSLDLKVGMLIPSQDILKEIEFIHDDYLLNVSPFILNLLGWYIKDSKESGLYKTILEIPHKNRHYLKTKLAGTALSLLDNSELNVAWIRINSTYTGEELYKLLVMNNVHILPGTNFFWDNPTQGKKYIRIALSRPESLFREATDLLWELSQRM